MRVVQGPVGGVVADHAAGLDRGDQRPGPGGGTAGVRRDDGDGED